MTVPTLSNFVGGSWVHLRGTILLDVENPATGEILARVPLSTGADVEDAVAAAAKTFPAWRETPPVERAR